MHTKPLDHGIEISVLDYGTGISGLVKDKIFQPFVTTKPTCEGTGLGLSLSYYIMTKGHNSSLQIKSQEGDGVHSSVAPSKTGIVSQAMT